MTMTVLPRPRSGPIGAAVRAFGRRAPANIAIVRRRSQPPAQFIARLTATAVFAYLLAALLPGSSQPVLAPLTAVLVVQATAYQTVRHAFQRVASVVAGVLLALVLSAALGFTWWTLGLTIAVALAVGSVLRLGDHLLEVPISAMLILSLDTRAAATGRVVDTLAGAAAGLVAGLVLSPAATQPAQDAIGDLSRQMADLLEDIASGLARGADPGETDGWLARARALTGEIQRVDDALGQAEDSLRLRPPRLRSARTAAPLRNGLETLEHAAVTIRGLARSIADDAGLPDSDAAFAADRPDLLPGVLRHLAAAVRAYGGLIRADLTTGQVPDGHELEQHLDAARAEQDRLTPVLRHAPDMGPASWRLRGEILVHLDRLTNELHEVERLAHRREGGGNPAGILSGRRPVRRGPRRTRRRRSRRFAAARPG